MESRLTNTNGFHLNTYVAVLKFIGISECKSCFPAKDIKITGFRIKRINWRISSQPYLKKNHKPFVSESRTAKQLYLFENRQKNKDVDIRGLGPLILFKNIVCGGPIYRPTPSKKIASKYLHLYKAKLFPLFLHLDWEG